MVNTYNSQGQLVSTNPARMAPLYQVMAYPGSQSQEFTITDAGMIIGQPFEGIGTVLAETTGEAASTGSATGQRVDRGREHQYQPGYDVLD